LSESWRKILPHSSKYFKAFEDLRAAVVNAFEDYMRDAAKVIRGMAKLRDEAERLVEQIVFR